MIKPNCLKVAKFVFILLVLPLSFVVFDNLSKVYAQTSGNITFQGKIVRNDTGYEGLNVTNGSPACVVSGADTCDFRIRYHSAATAGTLFFTETFENIEIGQYGGVFELGLGTGSGVAGAYPSISAMIQRESSIYVEILFSPAGDGSYTETFSRMPLRSSAFSFKSKFAEMATGAFLFENSANSLGYTGSDGMVYYDTTNSQLMLYTGGTWQALATGGNSLWSGASISSFTHAQFLETSGIATLANFGIDATEDRAWIHGSSSRTGLSVYSNYNAGTDWPLVSFKADSSSYGGSILRLIQDGTGDLLEGYVGSNSVFSFDNSGDLHLESDGIMYFEKFSILPTALDLAPLSGEGCVYTVGANIYWDSACDGASPLVLNTTSSLWSDAGAFTFLTSATDNLVLGGSTVADATFFFDVTGTSGNYFEVDSADNTERLFTISNAGNVGIGVANPTSKLQVAGTSSSISNTTGNLSILAYADLVVSTNSVERMRILSTGNVGIGNSTPSSLFSVGTSNGFQVDGSGDIVSIKGLSYLWPSAHTTNGVLTDNGSGTLSWSTIASLGGITGSGSAGQVAFFDSSSSVTGDNGFFWDNVNKRLGIGTTTPQSTIDIAGATSEIANSVGPISILPADGNLRMIGPGTSYGGSKITFGDSSNVYVGESGTGDSNILSLYGLSGISFSANSTEYMRLNSNGRVAIGTNLTSPLAGLDVSFANSATSDFIASRVQISQSVAGALTAYAYRAIGQTTHTTGTLTGLQVNSTQINVTGNGGTVSYAEGVTANASVSTGGIISNLALMRVFAPSGAGTIQNLKGLQIGNMNMGTSSNYSIYSEGGDMYHAGNIGIGRTPSYALDISGVARILNSGSSSIIELGTGTTTNQDAYIDLVGDTTYSDYGLRIMRGSTGANSTSTITHRGTGALGLNAYNAGSITLGTSNTVRLTVASNGDVGIGASPSYKLHVSGTGYFTGNVGVGAVPSSYRVFIQGPSIGTNTGSLGLKTPGSAVSERSGISLLGTFSSGTDYVPRRVADIVAGYDGGSWGNEYLAIGVGSSNDSFIETSERVRVTNSGRFILTAPAFPQYHFKVAGVSNYWDIFWNATTSNQFNLAIRYNNTTKFQFANDGTGYADTSWTTFSPYLSYNYIDSSKEKSDYDLGDVVKLDNSQRWVVNQTDSLGDSSLYGVVVRPEGFVSIPKELKEQLTDTKTISTFDVVPVAHLGEASTKILLKNDEEITPGQYITSSTLKGFAEVVKGSGNVLGKTLEGTSSWNENNCKFVESVDSIVWPEDDGSNPSKPCFRLPNGSYVGKLMVFVNVHWFDPKSSSMNIQISKPGWYRVLQTNGNESTTVKISNSTIGTNQNINLIVDPNNISVLSNFTSGSKVFSKSRLNTVDGVTYLEVYIENVDNNSVNVKVDSSTWSTITISKVVDTYTIKEYALGGVQFGITDTFGVSSETGSITTTAMYSDIGSSMNRWNDIYAKGAIRIGNGGDSEGGIRYNVEKKKLEFSNNGSTWVEVGDLTSSMVLSAEYSGAILYADGSENSGRMTSDAVEIGGTFKNYYEWVSDRDTLQDYDILVRITLPSDFVGWNEDAISLDFMTENSAMSTNNKVDLSLLGKSGIDAQITDGISKLPASWERISIKGSDIDGCNKANDTCTLKISMSSKESYFVRVGDITLNYNRGL